MLVTVARKVADLALDHLNQSEAAKRPPNTRRSATDGMTHPFACMSESGQDSRQRRRRGSQQGAW
ncbi:hypothetical protein BQ8794_50753 [Mesorhizobium prunaredense]|uniref:Uncharacterized protein n=1 Tax=Mesorhizobium prunaredense TaxID=1631249 RepID=A0A1R3VJN4_9HYPH|nr:hypothetical protein BQ8794_50753 [Mesorhizobium prunaredense]